MRIELPRAKHDRRDLYELGYTTAEQKALIHGGLLDTFKVQP